MICLCSNPVCKVYGCLQNIEEEIFDGDYDEEADSDPDESCTSRANTE